VSEQLSERAARRWIRAENQMFHIIFVRNSFTTKLPLSTKVASPPSSFSPQSQKKEFHRTVSSHLPYAKPLSHQPPITTTSPIEISEIGILPDRTHSYSQSTY